MGNVFSDAMDVLEADESVGVSILYHPAEGKDVSCRAMYDDTPEEISFHLGKVRDRKRILLVSIAKIASPAKGDTVEVPTGGTTFRVFAFSRDDIETARWRLELTDKLA